MSQSGETIDVSPEELATMASNLAHFILIQERTRVGVKRADIVEKILQGNARLLRNVLDEASRMLEDSVGYRIQEVPGKRVYILGNTVDLGGLEQHLVPDERWEAVRGLLCVILSLILMNNAESIQETDLWDLLGQINIERDDKQNPAFGDIEKLIKGTLVKQHYLDYAKKRDGSGEFSWGCRAHQEFKPMTLLKFVADIYGGGTSPSDFTVVYKRISEQEAQHPLTDDATVSGAEDASMSGTNTH